MAHITVRKKEGKGAGTGRLFFIARDGTRQSIRLGKVVGKNEKIVRNAERFCDKVSELESAARLGTWPDATLLVWADDLLPKVRAQLVKYGLLPEPSTDGLLTLKASLDSYIAKQIDWKQSTKIHFGHTQRNLLEFFKPERPLSSITVGDAKDFERWLENNARENRYADSGENTGLNSETVRKRIGNAKQFFADAANRELIPKNPFEGLESGTKGNRKRDYFLSREDAQKILAACPDLQWQLIFALARFGGPALSK